MRSRFPHNFWKETENHRKYLDSLGKKLNIEKWEDWYNVSVKQCIANGANRLFTAEYKGSLIRFAHPCNFSNFFIRALQQNYPEYPWVISKFVFKPHKHWQKLENQRIFFDDLAKKLNITQWSDWYQVFLFPNISLQSRFPGKC